jgi:peptide/nickel transport system permease protein
MTDAWRRCRKDKAAVFGAAVIAVVVAAAVLAPWVTRYDPHEQFFDGLTLDGSSAPSSARLPVVSADGWARRSCGSPT